jgi:DNA-binding SARP family transcriptional activator
LVAVRDLRVRLLGGLVVGGLHPSAVGSRKARTMFAALAVRPRRALPADVLAEILWPEQLPSRPGDQLGVLASRLRGVFGSERIRRSDAGYELAVDWVDVEELGAWATSAQVHLADGDGPSARHAAGRALALARGPLVPEEGAEWFERPRAAALRAVAAAALVGAEAALLAGDPLGATYAAQLALDDDPYDEAALRLLMRAHVAAGRPASALAAYAAMRTRLRDELGVSPDWRTEVVHTDALRTEPPIGVSAPLGRPHPSP